MKLKEISAEYRPRERFSRGERLSSVELLGVILGNGSKGCNVIDMCSQLISKYGLYKLKDLSLNELQTIKGIGIVKAIQIKALFEFGNRCNYINSQMIIKDAKDVYNYIKPKFYGLDREVFMIILLDTRNRVLKDEIVSIGTLNSCMSHPREIFKSAIREGCNSLILVHNHPSGDCSPSSEDLEVTKKLMEAGELLGIKVLDHLIVGDTYYSYSNKQQL